MALKNWSLIVKPMPGFAYGSRYPALVVEISAQQVDVAQLEGLLKFLRLQQNFEPDEAKWSSFQSSEQGLFLEIVEQCFTFLLNVQQSVKIPVYQRGSIFLQANRKVRAFVPTMQRSLSSLKTIVEWLIAGLNLLSNGADTQAHANKFAQLKHTLSQSCRVGTNPPQFMKAAYQYKIPFMELPSQIMHYGYGANACWLNSSFTQNTGVLGTNLARDKHVANQLMQLQGIPVVRNYVIGSQNEALSLASEIGYPVVIKPYDLDGGVGVAPDLQTPEEVINAFQTAQKYSTNTIIEKHFEGEEYRLTILDGDVLYITHRVRAQIVGDGARSVRQLVSRLNQDPNRLNPLISPMKPVLLDNEALELLARLKMTPESIPEKEQVISLRRTSNIANGGTPKILSLEQAHPDNLQLAIRAAQVFKLDIAGVDLIIPDIKHSWHDVGAIICEVNAQPGLTPTLAVNDLPIAVPIFKTLFKGNGRIPVGVIIGDDGDFCRRIESQLLEVGEVVGVLNKTGVYVNGQALVGPDVDFYAAANALLMNQHVTSILISISDLEVLNSGLPFEFYDFLILAGTSVSLPGSLSLAGGMQQLLLALIPCCDGQIWIQEGVKQSVNLELDSFESTSEATWHSPALEPSLLLKTLCEHWQQVKEAHKSFEFETAEQCDLNLIVNQFA